jgi:hypothetical protein
LPGAEQTRDVLDCEKDREEPLDVVDESGVSRTDRRTLSIMTTVTLSPIAISRQTSNNFPPRVPLSKMIR